MLDLAEGQEPLTADFAGLVYNERRTGALEARGGEDINTTKPQRNYQRFYHYVTQQLWECQSPKIGF